MHQLLTGKRGVVFGVLDASSIAWAVAERAHQAGASLVLTNVLPATRLGAVRELAGSIGAPFLAADATSVTDLEHLFAGATEALGGKIDFVLHSIGMSPNLRKKREYGDLDYAYFMKTLDVSALSLHKILQVAEKMDVLNEYASVVALTFLAAHRAFPDYGDMSQAKAMLESIARSYGARLGRTKHVRVNTVCQSPTPTTAGKGVPGFDALCRYSELMSPLGNPTAAECADFVVTLFSDLTRKVTMQCLYHDGGFSTTGISEDLIAVLDGTQSLSPAP
jgi:enoyl-[acyl-carrier protein] reductase I